MSREIESSPDKQAPEQSVSVLLKLAGERDAPSREAEQRARHAARNSWRHSLEQDSHTKRTSAPMRFAAVIALVMVAALIWMALSAHDVGTSVIVARISTIQGTTEVRAADGQLASIEPDQVIRAGAQIMTKEGRVALQLGETLSLRLNQHTRVTIDDVDHLTVRSGAVYVDSGGLNAATALQISTPAGEVRHQGTQFQIIVDGASTQISVREGQIILMQAAESILVGAGEQLQLDESGEHRRGSLPSFGPLWAWASDIAPALDVENRPLAEFLAWLTREQGWLLRYSQPRYEQRAHEIRLHGSIRGLSTQEMVERVSLITNVPLSVREGVLLVGESAGSTGAAL